MAALGPAIAHGVRSRVLAVGAIAAVLLLVTGAVPAWATPHLTPDPRWTVAPEAQPAQPEPEQLSIPITGDDEALISEAAEPSPALEADAEPAPEMNHSSPNTADTGSGATSSSGATASSGAGSGAANKAAAPSSAAVAPPASTPSTGTPAPTTDGLPPGGMKQGYAPGGGTIGGPELDTRGEVTFAGAPALPDGIDARGFVVADLETGDVLAAKDPHGKYYPASTIKLLTMLALHPHLDGDQVLTATVEDATVEGSRVGIVENGQYTVDQLWTAVVLQSGNDATRMLTTAVGGTNQALHLMNTKAASLQMFDTVAGTPSGLDVAGQSSSPYDLALMMRQVVQDPAMLEISGKTLGELPAQPPKYPSPMVYGTQNKLLLNYPGTIAGKTGFTDAARHTFVGAAERDGRTLVVSLMHAEQSPVPTWKQAATLLDWGFAAPASVSGAGRLVSPGDPLPVNNAPMGVAGTKTGSTLDLDAADPASDARAAGGSQYGDRHSIWPLLPMLGGLLLIAIWVAAPSLPRRR